MLRNLFLGEAARPVQIARGYPTPRDFASQKASDSWVLRTKELRHLVASDELRSSGCFWERLISSTGLHVFPPAGPGFLFQPSSPAPGVCPPAARDQKRSSGAQLWLFSWLFGLFFYHDSFCFRGSSSRGGSVRGRSLVAVVVVVT